MDYDKTRQLYQEIDKIKDFEATADFNRYNKECKWYENVRSKRSREYYQSDDLIRRELVAKGWKAPHVDDKGEPLKYPLKYVTGIYRVRIPDMTEWLVSTQEWYGIDVYGNTLNISMNFKERYDDIKPVYRSKAKDPKDRDPELELEVVSIRHGMKYTLPFTPENVDALYAMRGNRSCALVVKDESKDKPPYSIDTYDHLKNLEFDELWEMISVPRYKMDRSYGDRLDDGGVQ